MDAIFLQVLTDLTGGMRIDVATVVSGLLTLGCIYLVFDYIRALFDNWISRRDYASLENMKYEAEAARGTTKGDLLARRYRRRMTQFEKKYTWFDDYDD